MKPDSVAFEIILRSGGTGHTPSVHNLSKFQPDPEAIVKCRRWLSEKGITTDDTGFSLACSAPAAVFEAAFKVKLQPVKVGQSRKSWRLKGAVTIPAELDALIEDVCLQQPPDFFPAPAHTR